MIIYGAASCKSLDGALTKTRICSLHHTHTHAHTHTHTHTHTHAVQIHALLVMGWYNERKENDRSVYAEEKRRVFNFDLRKKEWRRMPDRERKRVADHRSDILKGSHPQGPPAHPRDTEYRSIIFFLLMCCTLWTPLTPTPTPTPTPHPHPPHPSSKINYYILNFFLIVIYNSKYFLAWLWLFCGHSTPETVWEIKSVWSVVYFTVPWNGLRTDRGWSWQCMWVHCGVYFWGQWRF